MAGRILVDVILVVGAFLLPWWVTAILGLAALFYFKNFYEAIAIGLVLDSIYGTSAIFNSFPYLLTMSALVLVLLVTNIRSRMIMY